MSETPLPAETPWWLKFAYTFGIPAALSVYLIWLLATRVEVKQDSAIDALKALGSNQEYVVRASETNLQKIDQVIVLLQRICVNSATDQTERNACFPE